MSASLPPRIVELQAIPKMYYRLMCSVILKRLAARSARAGRGFPRDFRREELLQDSFAHAWAWLSQCELSYWGTDMLSPQTAAILAAYRGADRAFDGRPIGDEAFSTRPLPNVLAEDVEERSETERMLPFVMDDIPPRWRALAVHIAQEGTMREWGELHRKTARWAQLQREELALIVQVLVIASKA